MNNVIELLTNGRFFAIAFVVTMLLFCLAATLASLVMDSVKAILIWATPTAKDEYEDKDDPHAELFHEPILPTTSQVPQRWGAERLHFNTFQELWLWTERYIPNSFRRTKLRDDGIEEYDSHGKYEIIVEQNWRRK